MLDAANIKQPENIGEIFGAKANSGKIFEGEM